MIIVLIILFGKQTNFYKSKQYKVYNNIGGNLKHLDEDLQICPHEQSPPQKHPTRSRQHAPIAVTDHDAGKGLSSIVQSQAEQIKEAKMHCLWFSL